MRFTKEKVLASDSTAPALAKVPAEQRGAGGTRGPEKRKCFNCQCYASHPVVHGHVRTKKTIALCGECQKDPAALEAKAAWFATFVDKHRNGTRAKAGG